MSSNPPASLSPTHRAPTSGAAASSGVRAFAEQLVERYYDAFDRHDIDGMLACLSEDVAHDVNQGSRRNGKAAFNEFCAHMSQCYREELTDRVVMASADGRRVAAEFVVRGTYLVSDEGLPPAKGQRYTLPAGAFLDVDGGLITRITTYYNLQEWLRQVGDV